MILKNLSTNTVLSHDLKEAKNLKEHAVGLLTRKTPSALLLHTRFGIHTFGMKFPIDVIVIDSTNRVVALKETLLPNRIFLWNPTYSTVIELPSGIVKITKTQTHHHIQIEPTHNS